MAEENGVDNGAIVAIENTPVKRNSLKETLHRAGEMANSIFRRDPNEHPRTTLQRLAGRTPDDPFTSQLSPLSSEQQKSLNLDIKSDSEGDFALAMQELESELSHAENKSEALQKIQKIAVIRVADANFDLASNRDEVTDPEVNSLIALAEKYVPQYPIRQQVEFQIKEKQQVAEYLKPGNFLAHGGYSDDISATLRSGGMRSTWSRINGGFLSANDEVPRWGKNFKSQPHAGALFFQPWNLNDRAGAYKDNKKGGTDITILYPSEEVAKKAKAIEVFGNSSYTEIAVTGSQDVYNKGLLNAPRQVDVSDDNLVLPFDKAFIVCFGPKAESVIQSFKQKGYSDEWINNHVKSYPDVHTDERQVYEENPGYHDALRDKKSEINNWLHTVYQPESDKIALERRLINPGTKNEFPGKVYSAKVLTQQAV